jgi:hypothetical protein
MYGYYHTHLSRKKLLVRLFFVKIDLSLPLPAQWNSFWPALKGSLSKVKKPCVRPKCAQCASGAKHPAYMLSVSRKGKRCCLYVPEELVAYLEKAIANAEKIDDLLYKQGPTILKEYRQQRDIPKDKKAKTKRIPRR